MLLRELNPRCHCALDSLTAQANNFDELFGLSRIGLILEAVLRPSNNSVERAPFFVITFAWADSSSLPQLIPSSSESNQSRSGLARTVVKSSPCTLDTHDLDACQNTQGHAMPCLNPSSIIVLLYSCCSHRLLHGSRTCD